MGTQSRLLLLLERVHMGRYPLSADNTPRPGDTPLAQWLAALPYAHQQDNDAHDEALTSALFVIATQEAVEQCIRHARRLFPAWVRP